MAASLPDKGKRFYGILANSVSAAAAETNQAMSVSLGNGLGSKPIRPKE